MVVRWYLAANALVTARSSWFWNGVGCSKVKPRRSSNLAACSYACCQESGGAGAAAAAAPPGAPIAMLVSVVMISPVYSGYRSIEPFSSPGSITSVGPMFSFSRTVKPSACSAWAYSWPRINASVKFFEPSVTAGLLAPGWPDGKPTTAVLGVKLLAEKFPPEEPQPASTAAAVSTSTAVRVRRPGCSFTARLPSVRRDMNHRRLAGGGTRWVAFIGLREPGRADGGPGTPSLLSVRRQAATSLSRRCQRRSVTDGDGA